MCITLGLLLLILAATGASWYYAIIVNLEEVAIASEVSKVYLPEGSFSSMPNLLPISITFKLNLVNVDIGLYFIAFSTSSQIFTQAWLGSGLFRVSRGLFGG